jgi:hypothetical protein
MALSLKPSSTQHRIKGLWWTGQSVSGFTACSGGAGVNIQYPIKKITVLFRYASYCWKREITGHIYISIHVPPLNHLKLLEENFR